MAAVYDNLLRDSILLRKDLEYALGGCQDKQVCSYSAVASKMDESFSKDGKHPDLEVS